MLPALAGAAPWQGQGAVSAPGHWSRAHTCSASQPVSMEAALHDPKSKAGQEGPGWAVGDVAVVQGPCWVRAWGSGAQALVLWQGSCLNAHGFPVRQQWKPSLQGTARLHLHGAAGACSHPPAASSTLLHAAASRAPALGLAMRSQPAPCARSWHRESVGHLVLRAAGEGRGGVGRQGLLWRLGAGLPVSENGLAALSSEAHVSYPCQIRGKPVFGPPSHTATFTVSQL